MKNRDEMVNSLLERRAQYVAEQKRTRMVLTRTIASMCCLCLVAVSCFGLWQHKTPGNTHGQFIDDALYPGVKDTFDDLHGESSADRIVIHPVTEIPSDTMNIALMKADFVPMSMGELKAYYDYDVFPVLPGNLNASEHAALGIYRRAGGTGTVYWDGNGTTYVNDDCSQTVHIEVRKDSLPLCGYVFYHSIQDKSTINGIDVAIGYATSGHYYAQFMHRGIGFQLWAQGLTQSEFAEILATLIQ